MECLSPICLENETSKLQMRYHSNFRYVPCGRCPSCIDRKRKEWMFRLKQEAKYSLNVWFVTLTYNDGNLPRNSLGYPCFNKRHIQLFLKKLRKDMESEYKKMNTKVRLRYFIVPEYGSKFGRPHYHGIFFNIPPDYDFVIGVMKHWQYGFTRTDDTSDESYGRISYLSNYIYGRCEEMPETNIDEQNKLFILSSRKPGIGSSYLTNEMIKWHIDDLRNFCLDNGFYYPIPRFYKDKIFSEEEKELIWHQVDKSIKENKAKLIAEEAARYQKYGGRLNALSVERRANFLRKFHNKVKKHNNENAINKEL